MGASQGLETPHEELKLFRQLRNEYEILKANGVISDAGGEKEAFERIKMRHEELTKLYSVDRANFKCPKVRFGKTELQMPILTCGGMRMQQTWAQKPDTVISKECQDNFQKIIDRSMELGINHFETARAYGTSEMQYAKALTKYKRKDYILQTKVPPKDDPAGFRQMLEKSFTDLFGVGYMDKDECWVDLLALHGINKPEQLAWLPGNMEVINEYKANGKVKFVGFSTHAMSPTIIAVIETGLFDYVNLHYHFIGSYTATGTGPMGGNIAAIEAAKKLDMGVFIISPTDKGGCLYEPPVTLYKACLPLTPIAFNNLFLWSVPGVHTCVIGTARPSDFDEHIESALLYEKRDELVPPIEARLSSMVTDYFKDPTFLNTWYKGLPDPYDNTEGLHIAQVYWFWWISKVWGLHTYSVRRYNMAEKTLLNEWDEAKPFEENVKAFGWCPGIAYRPAREAELREVLKDHPKCDHVVQAIKEVHEWLRDGGCIKRGVVPEGVTADELKDWNTAYNLQPDTPYPER